jgi:hypothetical protein
MTDKLKPSIGHLKNTINDTYGVLLELFANHYCAEYDKAGRSDIERKTISLDALYERINPGNDKEYSNLETNLYNALELSGYPDDLHHAFFQKLCTKAINHADPIAKAMFRKKTGNG